MMYNDLKYEKECMPLADKFYKSQFEIYGIKRWGMSKDERHMQLNDIDVTITVENHSNGTQPKHINISEKFRRDDWGDMLMELFTINKHGIKESWALTTKSEYIVYFTPTNTYVVDSQDLKDFARSIESYVKNEIDSFTKEKRNSKDINIKDFKAKLIKSQTTMGGSTWENISIAIDWRTLEKNGVEIYKYKFAL